MPKSFSRMRRVESLIQKEIAQLIEFEFKDSELGLVTVTGIKVSPDLAQAKVYITIHEQEKIAKALQLLNKEAKSLRHLLGSRIKLRRIPALHFYHDEVFERGSRISELLNK